MFLELQFTKYFVRGLSLSKHLFLYLDILGFTEFLENPAEVEELYGIIDRLNVFRHDSFECIVFSDTILIYDNHPVSLDVGHMRRSVMWLCEFAQDLLYRLISTDRHFRALLTIGDFKSSQLKNIQYFYGKALVDTYLYEKKIQSTGLYINNSALPFSNIFKTTPYDKEYSYVFLTQNLNNISDYYSHITIEEHAEIVESQGLEGLYVYDFIYLQNIYRSMNDTSLPGSVRTKYVNTWNMLSKRYCRLQDALVVHNFDLQKIIKLDWTPWSRNVRNKRGFHG